MTWTSCVVLVVLVLLCERAVAGSPPECSPDRCVPSRGRCVTAKRLVSAVFEYDPAMPKQLVQRLQLVDGATFCQCHDGYWGEQCESACPSYAQDPLRLPCGGADSHVQLPSPAGAEACGQVFHAVPMELVGNAPAEWAWLQTNHTWALPGMCNCRAPLFGSACQWSVGVESAGGSSMLPTWTDWLRPPQTPPYTVLTTRVNRERLPAPKPDVLCSGSLNATTGGSGTAGPMGCQCQPGVFPTTLRGALPPMPVSTMPPGRSWGRPTVTPGVAGAAAWTFSQVPLCSIRATKFAGRGGGDGRNPMDPPPTTPNPTPPVGTWPPPAWDTRNTPSPLSSSQPPAWLLAQYPLLPAGWPRVPVERVTSVPFGIRAASSTSSSPAAYGLAIALIVIGFLLLAVCIGVLFWNGWTTPSSSTTTTGRHSS